MKQTWQCPKCRSVRVGYFERVPDQASGARTRSLGEPKGFGWPNQGVVEAFVCADCGYFEEYVADVADVRWEDLSNFRWCRPELARG